MFWEDLELRIFAPSVATKMDKFNTDYCPKTYWNKGR